MAVGGGMGVGVRVGVGVSVGTTQHTPPVHPEALLVTPSFAVHAFEEGIQIPPLYELQG